MSGIERTPTPATIVVADDETSVRELIAEGLESFGFRVLQAKDAAEAFDRVGSGGVDLVLSDIDMPGESGLELLRRIKALDGDVDVVMVTGNTDIDTAVDAIRRGASDYVRKPFNLEEVRIVVERTLAQRRLILENREYQRNLEAKVEERTRETVRLFRELDHSYEVTLDALVTALDFRDNETHGHSRRVVEYAVVVAEKLGVTGDALVWLRRGAILHDVGKIGVPDAILHKPGKLDPDERKEMEKHPENGWKMLRHIPFLEPALAIVYCHQERWDGTGYPRGLRGEEIPLGARIFAVVDTFDAMTSDRPYRAALSIETARDEIRRFAGVQFDPAVAEAFLSIDPAVWREIRERVHDQVNALAEDRKAFFA